MARAGIFIGVDRTGQLQRLHDAAAGARRMYEWACRQGMTPGTHAKLITDENGAKVTPDQIFDAVHELVSGAGVDQLIIYFAGHGVNKNRSEHWLLSDAPVRPHAAVNVAGSVDQARYAGIPHVVFISDACRVAPEGIQAQRVEGVEIFPNEDYSDKAKPVDQFFACVLGRTAAEIRDPAEAAGSFTALYTSVLLEALDGRLPDALTPGQPPDAACYVRPAGLRDALDREMPRRLLARGLAGRVNQTPDAIVVDHPYWLARLDTAPAVATRGGVAPAPEARGGPAARSPAEAARTLLRVAMTGSTGELAATMAPTRSAVVDPVTELAEDAARVATPFGADHHETHCGVKVRGAHIVEFRIVDGQAEHAVEDGTDLRVAPPPNPASIWLRFSGDVGTVVPVIEGFLTVVSLEDGEIVDVAFEPSAWHHRRARYGDRLPELRMLRGIASAVSRQGRFRLEGPEAAALASRMRVAGGLDPALALYAAYAYHDLQQADLLDALARELEADLGVQLFDVAMLARRLVGEQADRAAHVVPFVPMLSQGWALLRAHRLRLHPALDGVERHVRDSLWSLYDREGLERLREALESREVW
jgi:hypothetical protein